jgi:hypothetical protein
LSTHGYAHYFALLLAGIATHAAAQNSTPASQQSTACEARTSRAARPCEPTTTTIAVEKETTFTLELRDEKPLQCAATVQIVYTQRNTLASVEGTIDHEECGASDGEHRLTVNVRDEGGEVQSLAFVHAWRRDDDQPVTFEAEYAIPEKVDLLSVRARQIRCSCADVAAEAVTAAD